MRFTVTGRVGFPIDMLRFDTCYPATEADSAKIYQTLAGHNTDGVSVDLIMDHGLRGRRTRRPNEGRWESFMWKVTDMGRSRGPGPRG